MANRYPLVIDTLDSNKIKELQTGDNLNLADNSILGVQNITALGTIEAAVITVNGNRVVAQDFVQLTDTPANYTGHGDKFVAVKADASGLEFRPLSAFGTITTSGLNAGGNILPTVTNTHSIGSATAKFANVYAADFVGNVKAFDDSLVFNASTGKIAYASISGAPSNVSEFTNDVGFATTSGINQYITDYFAGAGGNALQVDITGSVFADDSTVMIDAVAGKIVGDIHYPTIGSITAGTKVQLGTTELTSTIEPPTTNTGAIGTTTKRFGAGYFQNINASGNITASTLNGTLNGIVIGDVTGSVFGDDSSVLVDAVSGIHYGPLVGDVTGSVFSDDSGVLIDGINGIVVCEVNTTKIRTSEEGVTLGFEAGTSAGRTTQIALGRESGKVNQRSGAIAIGHLSAGDTQGFNAIAIGTSAATTNQANTSIVINATGTALENTTVSSLVIKPIRGADNANFLKYNTTTGEVTYVASAAGVFTGDLTGSVFADDSTLLIDGVNARHNFPNNVIADLSNVSANSPTAGQVLKWDGAQWAPAADATSGGGGLDADTLDGQNSPYFLAWNNFTGTPTTLSGYGITDAITASSTNTLTNKSLTKAQVTDLLTGDFNVSTNKILYSNVYTDLSDLPAAASYHGMFAHVHNTTKAYYAHGGNWVELANVSETIGSLVADTSPQLGGTLDANSNTIDMGTHILTDTNLGQFITAHGWGNHASGGYQSASGLNAAIDTHINQSNPTSGYVLSWNGTDYQWVVNAGGGAGAVLYAAESTGGVNPTASGTLSLAIGSSASATGTWATAVGKGASASATYSAAFGNGAKATASFGIALGASVAAGVRSFAAVIDDVSGTYGAKGLGSIAMGKQATATGDNAVAIGFNATAAANQIVLGNNTQTIKAGAFTLFGSTMDTDDSSSITVTPAMILESDLTVQNDLVVNNTITANKFVSSAVGSPKITSATNIELNAGGVVIVGKSALRLYSVTTTQRNALTASTGDIVYNSTLLKYQVRIGSAWKSLTIADDVPTNNNQLTNGAGYLTSAAEHTFTMTANGSSAYRFAQDTRYFPLASEDDPVLYVRRGETYNFINNSGGSHPFQIRTSNGGSAYNTGVTNNGAASGTISWTVPMTAPSTVYYQCTAHSGMGNTINIVT